MGFGTKIMKCENCLLDTGKYTKSLECCELRMIAKAPRHRQKLHAETMTKKEREEFRPLVIAEIERLKMVNDLKQTQAKTGHLAAGGGLTLTQQERTGKSLSDAAKEFRSIEKNVAPKIKPVLGWKQATK